MLDKDRLYIKDYILFMKWAGGVTFTTVNPPHDHGLLLYIYQWKKTCVKLRAVNLEA